VKRSRGWKARLCGVEALSDRRHVRRPGAISALKLARFRRYSTSGLKSDRRSWIVDSDFLFVNNTNYNATTHRFPDIDTQSRIFAFPPTPPLFNGLVGGVPSTFGTMFGVSETRVPGLSCGENPVILGSTVSIQSQRWTDRRTDFHSYFVHCLQQLAADARKTQYIKTHFMVPYTVPIFNKWSSSNSLKIFYTAH